MELFPELVSTAHKTWFGSAFPYNGRFYSCYRLWQTKCSDREMRNCAQPETPKLSTVYFRVLAFRCFSSAVDIWLSFNFNFQECDHFEENLSIPLNTGTDLIESTSRITYPKNAGYTAKWALRTATQLMRLGITVFGKRFSSIITTFNSCKAVKVLHCNRLFVLRISIPTYTTQVSRTSQGIRWLATTKYIRGPTFCYQRMRAVGSSWITVGRITQRWERRGCRRVSTSPFSLTHERPSSERPKVSFAPSYW